MECATKASTIFGIGPRLLGWTLAYAIIPVVLTKAHPDAFVIALLPPALFNFFGGVLLVLGASLWFLSIPPLLRAFRQGKLCTTGAYSIVRNPVYSAYIVFIIPALTLFLRSWILFTVPIVMALIFRKLIRVEERFLEEQFGAEYLKYKSEVNALIPSFKSFKRH